LLGTIGAIILAPVAVAGAGAEEGSNTMTFSITSSEGHILAKVELIGTYQKKAIANR